MPSNSIREPAPAPGRSAGGRASLPITLGPRLRPIVLGVGGDATLATQGGASSPPQLLLGVHAFDGRLLGYFVAQAVRSEGTWGGMTLGPFGLGEAVVLARRSAAALGLVGLRHAAHHCLCSVPAGATTAERERSRKEYVDALQPLARVGLGRVAFSDDAEELRPTLACAAAVATAEALTLRLLADRAVAEHRGSVALYGTAPLASSVVGSLERRGLSRLCAGESGLGADADVLVVGSSLSELGLAEANAVRAKVVLALGESPPGAPAESRLHERGVTVLPASLVLGGMFAVLDFRARGLDERTALERGVGIARERLDRLAEIAELERTPLSATVRAAASPC
jgi:hypothetical protein